MNRNHKVTSLILGLFCGALSYWFNAYNVMMVFGLSIYLVLAVTTFTSAFGFALLHKKASALSPVLICTGVIIAAFGRIFYDISKDATSHNLFPFEILIILGISAPCAFIGWWFGNVLNKRIKITP